MSPLKLKVPRKVRSDCSVPLWPGALEESGVVDDRVSDAVLEELEQLAQEVDRLESTATDEEASARVWARRQRLLIELDVSGLLEGTNALRARLERRPALAAYHAACLAMRDYLASAARARFFPPSATTPKHVPRISLDWFRRPSDYVPAGVTPHEWLALCERNFVEPLPSGEGTRFLRLEGTVHVMLYRRETGPEPVLWRVLPA